MSPLSVNLAAQSVNPQPLSVNLSAGAGGIAPPPGQSNALEHHPTGLKHQLPGALSALVHQLGRRATPVQVTEAIRQLCNWRPLGAAELAEILGRGKKHLVRNHLSPMVDAGELERTLPDQPNHPDQRYRAITK